MPRRPKIKWTKNQLAELRRDVRAFNALRTRAAKGDPSIVDFLPPKLNVGDLRETITTRAELTDVTRYVNRALKSNFEVIKMPGGVVDLNFNIEETRRRIKRINKERAERSSVLLANKRIGKVAEVALKPKREDVENIKPKNWEKFQESVIKQADPKYWEWRYRVYKEGYLKAVFDNLAGAPNYDELYDYLEKIPAKDMWEASVTDYHLEIDFLYPVSDSTLGDYAQEILDAWKAHMNSR